MEKTKFNGLAGRYRAALRDYLAPAAPEDLLAAQDLGREAVTLGVETLDLARIHEAALKAVMENYTDTAVRAAPTARAGQFFAEVLVPLEATRGPAFAAGMALTELNAALLRKSADIADSRSALLAGVSLRHSAESALQASGAESTRLLAEARQLQHHLQELARRILTSQEEERKKMSLTLQDEIAQTLLAIQVRLLALKREVTASTASFQKEIATTRRLVQNSVQTINRFARQCGLSHET